MGPETPFNIPVSGGNSPELSSSPAQRGLAAMRSLFGRHFRALGYVLTKILPALFRTGHRPVIFVRHSGIGDIICTFPAALELRKRHPGATFIYVCHPDYVDVPRLAGVADRIDTFFHVGLVGHWYHFLLGGYYHFESDDDHPSNENREVYIKDFGRKFGVELDGSHPRFQPSAESIRRINERLPESFRTGPRIVIHPGPSWPVKEWPHSHWAELVRELQASGYANIIHLGVGKVLRFGPTDVPPIPGVFSFVDQLSLEDAVAVISTADLYIGIDSGPLHIAAAMRIPAIGLWGFTRPELRFSDTCNQRFMVSPIECQGCHDRIPRLHWYSGCPFDIQCMKMISVPTVLNACLEWLAERTLARDSR